MKRIGILRNLPLLMGAVGVICCLQPLGADDEKQSLKRSAEASLPADADDSETANPSNGKSDMDDNEATEETYLLRYKFSANQFAHYRVVHNMSIHTQYAEASEKVTTESIAEKHFRVVSVDSEGSAVLEPIIDRVRMRAQFDEHDPVVFDSESSNPPPPQFRDVQKTIGKKMARLKVADHGELISVLRIQGQGSASADDAPELDPSQNFLIVLPEEPIRIGDTWTDKFDVKVNVNESLQRKITLLRTYRLESVKDGRATIRLKTSEVTKINSPSVRAQMVQRTPSGVIEFDLERGLIAAQKFTIDRTEIGVFGDKSSLRAVSERTEQLIPAKAVARKDQSDSKPKRAGPVGPVELEPISD